MTPLGADDPLTLANALSRRAFLAGTAAAGALLYLPAQAVRQRVPPGLTVHSNGSITGTPTKAGTYQFPVTIRDKIGQTSVTPVTMTIAR